MLLDFIHFIVDHEGFQQNEYVFRIWRMSFREIQNESFLSYGDPAGCNKMGNRTSEIVTKKNNK